MEDIEQITDEVRVIEIERGKHPTITVEETVRQGGKVRHFRQCVPVPEELLLRLIAEVGGGDRIRLTVETNWSLPGLPKRVVAFEKVIC